MRPLPSALELPSDRQPTPTAVLARGVSRAFGTGEARTQALLGLDLRIAAGELVSLVGPSGCGKSTLLRLLAGLLAPDSGDLLLFGLPVETLRAGHRIGYVPQDLALLPWLTALGNVALAMEIGAGATRRDAQARARVLLERVGSLEFAHRYPYQLSGGMRQRVALARALATRPALLLLDEPFAALDELSREALRAELQDWWSDDRPATVFVTHSVAEAVTLSDRVVVLSGRPGRALGEVEVALPRPRGPHLEQHPDYLEALSRVRLLLRG